MFADKKAVLGQIKKKYKKIIRLYLIYGTAPLSGKNCSVHW